jgi:hypothetical protein
LADTGDGSNAAVDDTTLADPAADTDAATAATGDFAGWDMPFTDPWGGYDPYMPGAWDSHFTYPGFGWGHGF